MKRSKLRATVFAVLLGALWLALMPSVASADPAGLPGPSTEAPRPQPAVGAPAPVLPTPSGGGIDDTNYRLGSGDKLKVTVYGEDDLSGEFFVDGSGQVQMPLLGQIRAAGLTVHEFVMEVQTQLGAKYLRDPKVSVEIENYRPFYIIGEVNKPGEYPFENGLNILGAIALAGGYTFRADDSDVYIRRNGDPKELTYPANALTRVYPGDIVRVAERIF